MQLFILHTSYLHSLFLASCSCKGVWSTSTLPPNISPSPSSPTTSSSSGGRLGVSSLILLPSTSLHHRACHPGPGAVSETKMSARVKSEAKGGKDGSCNMHLQFSCGPAKRRTMHNPRILILMAATSSAGRERDTLFTDGISHKTLLLSKPISILSCSYQNSLAQSSNLLLMPHVL